VCVPLHLLTRLALGRSGWPPRFLGAVGWIMGARVRVRGDLPGPHSLLLSNHVSWLDILVLGGATRCAFVSKDNLGPGFAHWLADFNNTVYVDRDNRRTAKNQAVTIAQALERDQPVALFPEGTVGPGDQVLPFRSTLIEAVNFARRDVEVRPVAIDYGAAATEISWFEQSGRDNVLQVLRRRGTLPVTVTILPPLERTGDRKALARAAQAAIAKTLASSRGATPLYPADR
jgi:1-acyl-sn-glycerol-3-phosphate acyltransferase